MITIPRKREDINTLISARVVPIRAKLSELGDQYAKGMDDLDAVAKRAFGWQGAWLALRTRLDFGLGGMLDELVDLADAIQRLDLAEAKSAREKQENEKRRGAYKAKQMRKAVAA